MFIDFETEEGKEGERGEERRGESKRKRKRNININVGEKH